MDALQHVLTRVKRRDPAVLASAAGVAALLVVLKWATGSKSKSESPFVTNFAEIASKDGNASSTTYDVVVVGGGAFSHVWDR